jgi:GTP-binding protein
VHFLRNARTAKGGPDGGDGGKGGSIRIRANSNMWTLLHLRYRKHIFAENGEGGSRNNKFGADADDIILEAPCGTVAKDAETGEWMGEVLHNNDEIILLKGGRGGLGNTHFATPTNQAPRHAQPGEPGEEKTIVLELKVLADVGLVGFPNAGKSTLLAAISAAKPRIADYPFTTLTPNLGIVSYRNNLSFVMADIPGIIENAHQGKGLGLRFLRHIERNAVLLFMVSCESLNILEDYTVLLNELRQYNPALLDKKHVLAVTKCDILDPELIEQLTVKCPKELPVVFISAVSGLGIQDLKDTLWNMMQTDQQMHGFALEP